MPIARRSLADRLLPAALRRPRRASAEERAPREMTARMGGPTCASIRLYARLELSVAIVEPAGT